MFLYVNFKREIFHADASLKGTIKELRDESKSSEFHFLREKVFDIFHEYCQTLLPRFSRDHVRAFFARNDFIPRKIYSVYFFVGSVMERIS